MTNGDVLRAMNDEALADFLNTLKYNCCDGKCGDCPVSGYEDVECDCSVEEWLKRPVEEETA